MFKSIWRMPDTTAQPSKHWVSGKRFMHTARWVQWSQTRTVLLGPSNYEREYRYCSPVSMQKNGLLALLQTPLSRIQGAAQCTNGFRRGGSAEGSHLQGPAKLGEISRPAVVLLGSALPSVSISWRTLPLTLSGRYRQRKLPETAPVPVVSILATERARLGHLWQHL